MLLADRPDHRAQVYRSKPYPAGADEFSARGRRLYWCEVIGMSKFMVLLYADESGMPSRERPSSMRRTPRTARSMRISPSGAHLSRRSAAGEHVGDLGPRRGGQRQDTPGPAAGQAEQLIGYYVLDCKDQQEAAEPGGDHSRARRWYGRGATRLRDVARGDRATTFSLDFRPGIAHTAPTGAL